MKDDTTLISSNGVVSIPSDFDGEPGLFTMDDIYVPAKYRLQPTRQVAPIKRSDIKPYIPFASPPWHRWVVKGLLARSRRPGFSVEKAITKKDMERWVDEAKAMGIKSVITILKDELEWYKELYSKGLSAFYRSRGLNAYLVQRKDFSRPVLTSWHKQEIAWKFMIAPKPVIIHCSAGIDRTGAAIDYLFDSRVIAGNREDKYAKTIHSFKH